MTDTTNTYLIARLDAAETDYTIEYGSGDLYGLAKAAIESQATELEHCRRFGIAAHDSAGQWMAKAKAAEAELARVRAAKGAAT